MIRKATASDLDAVEALRGRRAEGHAEKPEESAFMVKFAAASRAASKKRRKAEDAGEHIPPFLIASITSQCNLHCAGCYSRCNHATVDAAPVQQLTGRSGCASLTRPTSWASALSCWPAASRCCAATSSRPRERKEHPLPDLHQRHLPGRKLFRAVRQVPQPRAHPEHRGGAGDHRRAARRRASTTS